MSVQGAVGPPSHARRGDHVGVLYADEDSLFRVVARWLQPALAHDGAGLIVATPEHAEGVRRALLDLGIDADACANEGRLLVIDAEWLMARFFLDRAPEAGMFHALLDGFLGRLSGARGEIRAWGEMVNVLWARGDRAAARLLEELWEEAIERRGFALLCSYCTRDLDPKAEKLLAHETAASHWRVIDA